MPNIQDELIIHRGLLTGLIKGQIVILLAMQRGLVNQLDYGVLHQIDEHISHAKDVVKAVLELES